MDRWNPEDGFYPLDDSYQENELYPDDDQYPQEADANGDNMPIGGPNLFTPLSVPDYFQQMEQKHTTPNPSFMPPKPGQLYGSGAGRMNPLSPARPLAQKLPVYPPEQSPFGNVIGASPLGVTAPDTLLTDAGQPLPAASHARYLDDDPVPGAPALYPGFPPLQNDSPAPAAQENPAFNWTPPPFPPMNLERYAASEPAPEAPTEPAPEPVAPEELPAFLQPEKPTEKDPADLQGIPAYLRKRPLPPKKPREAAKPEPEVPAEQPAPAVSAADAPAAEAAAPSVLSDERFKRPRELQPAVSPSAEPEAPSPSDDPFKRPQDEPAPPVEEAAQEPVSQPGRRRRRSAAGEVSPAAQPAPVPQQPNPASGQAPDAAPRKRRRRSQPEEAAPVPSPAPSPEIPAPCEAGDCPPFVEQVGVDVPGAEAPCDRPAVPSPNPFAAYGSAPGNTAYAPPFFPLLPDSEPEPFQPAAPFQGSAPPAGFFPLMPEPDQEDDLFFPSPMEPPVPEPVEPEPIQAPFFLPPIPEDSEEDFILPTLQDPLPAQPYYDPPIPDLISTPPVQSAGIESPLPEAPIPPSFDAGNGSGNQPIIPEPGALYASAITEEPPIREPESKPRPPQDSDAQAAPMNLPPKAPKLADKPPIRPMRVLALTLALGMAAFCIIAGCKILLGYVRNTEDWSQYHDQFVQANGISVDRAGEIVPLQADGSTFQPTSAPTPLPTPLLPEDTESSVQPTATQERRTRQKAYPDNPLRNILPAMTDIHTEYPDVVGRIVIPGVLDEWFVKQRSTYYLNHNYRGTSSTAGAVYMDASCTLDLPPENLHLRGRDTLAGKTFHVLWQYKTGGMDFVYNARGLTITTLYEEMNYLLLAVLETPQDPSHPNYFNYVSHPTFATDEEMLDYVAQLKQRSIYQLPTDIQPGDRLLTLSTVSDEDVTSGSGTCLVLVFRSVR